MPTDKVEVRQATAADAAGISAIWERIVAERKFSAVARAWLPSEEATYLQGLSPREAVFVAIAEGRVVGFQTLDRWVTYPSFMDHAGQLGTFVVPEWRGRGTSNALARATLGFAREHGYRKLVIWVRGSNEAAQRFYAGLGFRPCGRLSRQLLIDDVYDDEVLMELFL
jgi:ribosomal-protein-alanine N-acetyltransferase